MPIPDVKILGYHCFFKLWRWTCLHQTCNTNSASPSSASSHILTIALKYLILSSLRHLVDLRQLTFKIILFCPVLRKDFISLHPDDKTSQWWIHNYRWFHISSELLQSPYMVIVTEVICIKLIIPNHKGHKSVHYQFQEKCFKHTFFYIFQGKRGWILPSIKWSLAVSI